MRVHSIPHGWLVHCDNALPGAPNDGFSAVLGAVLLGFHLERDGPAEPVQGHGGDSGGRLGSASFRLCKYVDAYC